LRFTRRHTGQTTRATMLCNLASLLKAQAKYEESEALYRRALAIREVLYGLDG